MQTVRILILSLFSFAATGQTKYWRTFNDTVFAVGNKIHIYQPSYSTSNPMLGTPNEIDSLKSVADFLNKHKNITFELQSHTDGRGSAASNLKLSQIRAESYKDYLIKYYKVDSAQIIPKGYGSKQLILTNDIINSTRYTKEEKEILHSKNRRAVLVVLSIE